MHLPGNERERRNCGGHEEEDNKLVLGNSGVCNDILRSTEFHQMDEHG
jgi:hypothetical protein